LEKQGPHKREGQRNPVSGEWIDSEEWDHDFFYLEMTKYKFHHTPTPDGRMPRDPALDWDLGDWYDPYPMMHEAKDDFYDEMETWRKRQLHIICRLIGPCAMEERVQGERNCTLKKNMEEIATCKTWQWSC
jgi:hypothetical protein